MRRKKELKRKEGDVIRRAKDNDKAQLEEVLGRLDAARLQCEKLLEKKVREKRAELTDLMQKMNQLEQWADEQLAVVEQEDQEEELQGMVEEVDKTRREVEGGIGEVMSKHKAETKAERRRSAMWMEAVQRSWNV